MRTLLLAWECAECITLLISSDRCPSWTALAAPLSAEVEAAFHAHAGSVVLCGRNAEDGGDGAETFYQFDFGAMTKVAHSSQRCPEF